MKRIALILALVVPAWASAQTAPGGLVGFGDSLSDSGNFFIQTGQQTRAPFPPIPVAPYAIGGHHFSNGKTWIEQLAADLRVPQSAKPSMRAGAAFTNYAFGRSRARAGAPTFPDFDLTTQVGLFLGDFGAAPADATYVIWIGSNDVRDALEALAVDPSGVTSGLILQAAILSIGDNVFTLWDAGARNFLILNSPNLAIIPAVAAQSALVQFFATLLSENFNNGLAAVVAGLSGLPGIHIDTVDVFAVLNELVADPEAAGISNVTDPCLTPGVVGGAICSQPNDHLFFDFIHPTTVGHGVLAEAAAAVLAP